MTENIFCPEHGVVEAEIIDDGKMHEFKKHVHVVLKNNSRAELQDNSSAVLCGNSSAVLRGNSRAVLWGNSSAELWDNSSAVLWGNSSAELQDNSSAVLRGNSSAVLRGNSSAVLWGNSRAVLWGNSRAVLWDNSSAVLHSLFVAAILRDKGCKATGGKAKQRIALLSQTTEPREWLKAVGAKMDGRKTILYKRTGHEFETKNGIHYLVGSLVEEPDWDPKPECGGGLHFCIDPAGCDAFRDGKDDRYVACLVDPKDIVVHARPEYPDKIKAKKCKVLYECDREGKKIKGAGKK